MTKIGRVAAHALDNIPIQPPPYRSSPSTEHAVVVEVETDDGLVGWSLAGYAHPMIVDLINVYLGPAIVGRNPMQTEFIHHRLQVEFSERQLGRLLILGIAAIDIALWDIKGKALGLPVHHLIGGAREKVPVYITHGAAYGVDAKPYDREELAAEAKHLVELGNRHLKNTVGRQAVPNPREDYQRMKAMREAVGDDIELSMDANALMSAPAAAQLCRLTEELGISFFEEPVRDNDPRLLLELKQQTTIPIAASAGRKHRALELLGSGAIDIMQPNVNNDGGFTSSLRIAAMAQEFNITLGHGNGNGPHNIALQAGVPNGGLVEYHFHKWMAYNAIFEKVPQPEDGYLAVSQEPGLGLNIRPGLIDAYKVAPEALRGDKVVVRGPWSQ